MSLITGLIIQLWELSWLRAKPVCHQGPNKVLDFRHQLEKLCMLPAGSRVVKYFWVEQPHSQSTIERSKLTPPSGKPTQHFAWSVWPSTLDIGAMATLSFVSFSMLLIQISLSDRLNFGNWCPTAYWQLLQYDMYYAELSRLQQEMEKRFCNTMSKSKVSSRCVWNVAGHLPTVQSNNSYSLSISCQVWPHPIGVLTCVILFLIINK